MTEQLVIKGIKKNIRFHTTQGNLSTEDLFKLPLPTVDQLYVQYVQETQKSSVSLLQKKTRADHENELRAAILKYVIEERMADEEKAEKRAKAREQKNYLMSLLAEKQAEGMKEMDEKKLQKMIKELENELEED